MRVLLHGGGQRPDPRGPDRQAAPRGRDRERGLGLSSPDHVSLTYVIGRVNQGILREMRARLAGVDLSVQEYTALSVLRARPRLSNAQLARRALVTPQSMIETLSKLERRGLVTRETDPEHGRILRAEVTASGRWLLELADPAIEQIGTQMLADVPKRDRAIVMNGMVSAMRRLSDGLDD